jgi:agmatine deiminase
MAASNPSSLGFSMPAEWEPHSATWLSWPKNPDTFPSSIIDRVENAYCKMVGALSAGEKVKVLVDDENEERRAEKILSASGAYSNNVLFVTIKSVDVWVRDYCPVFLLNRKTGKKCAVKWNFNAWGGKYDDLAEDNETGEKIAGSLPSAFPLFRPGIVMEGGSIEVNGDGALLTTEQCLLNKNRNQKLNRKEIEVYLHDYIGVSRIIWLKEGIAGDDTDGHIDDFARFVGKNTVLCANEKNGDDANFAALEKNSSLLSEAGFVVVRLPMPSPIIDPGENRRLPASYANFYVANSCVLLPVFDDKNDAKAIETLQGCFPKREIVPIPCRELVYGYGGVHCVTQQEPK